MSVFHRKILRTATSAKTEKVAAPTLSVMQFNVFAHCFRHGETREEFDVRRNLNLDYVLAMSPTLCVMEEVDSPDLYATTLSQHGYRYVSDRKNNKEGDHTCVFYRPECGLDLLNHATYRFKNEDGAEAAQMALLCRFNFKDTPLLVVAQHAKAGRLESMESRRIFHSHCLFSELESFFATDEGKAYQDRVLWVGK